MSVSKVVPLGGNTPVHSLDHVGNSLRVTLYAYLLVSSGKCISVYICRRPSFGLLLVFLAVSFSSAYQHPVKLSALPLPHFCICLSRTFLGFSLLKGSAQWDENFRTGEKKKESKSRYYRLIRPYSLFCFCV